MANSDYLQVAGLSLSIGGACGFKNALGLAGRAAWSSRPERARDA